MLPQQRVQRVVLLAEYEKLNWLRFRGEKNTGLLDHQALHLSVSVLQISKNRPVFTKLGVHILPLGTIQKL